LGSIKIEKNQKRRRRKDMLVTYLQGRAGCNYGVCTKRGIKNAEKKWEGKKKVT